MQTGDEHSYESLRTFMQKHPELEVKAAATLAVPITVYVPLCSNTHSPEDLACA